MVPIGLKKLPYGERSIGTIVSVSYEFPEFVMALHNPKFGSMNIGLKFIHTEFGAN